MVVEKGYGKINLGLEVVNKRDDGYHDLAMIMTSIELSDELYLEDDPFSQQVKIDCDKMSHIALEDNLIYQAAKLLKDRYNIKKGVKIRVVKRIPEQAGLAGGSADAAATLRGLNELWELKLSLEELASLGLSLGSDVPFCLYNQTAKVSGRGENLEFIDDCPFAYLLLVIPSYRNSTAEVFQNFVVHHRNVGKISQLEAEIKEGNINLIAKKIFNDLEVGPRQSEINRTKQMLLQAGALGSSLTGSGSAVYGIFFNEKQARNAEAKLKNKTNQEIILTSIRSHRKPNLTNFTWEQIPKKPQILATTEGKATAFIALGYHRIWDHYRLIATPVSTTNTFLIQKLNVAVCEIKYGEEDIKDDLFEQIKKIVDKTGQGLRIHINAKHQKLLGLLNPDHYLAAIIKNLDAVGINSQEIFPLFPALIEAYASEQSFEFDSKTNQYQLLGEAVFGYVLVASLDLKGYNSPRYTSQAAKKKPEADRLKQAIHNRNFYEMAANAYNGISGFEKSAIQKHRRFSIIDKAQELSWRLGASGFILTHETPKILCLCRYQQQAQAIGRNLQKKYRLNNYFVTSIQSSLKHEPIQSFLLEETPIKENIKHSLEQYLIQEEIKSRQEEEIPIFEEASYQEGSPFTNDDLEIIPEEQAKAKSAYRKTIRTLDRSVSTDIEGVLYLHSGGSLFKQYDFVDIAHYFQKFFHGKAINIDKEGEKIKVIFFTSSLPHILGIHLLDEKDPTLRGAKGFNRLINGEFSYYQLKKSGRYSKKIIQEIYEKTQSSVLIFNDIYHNRPLNCFGKENVKGASSKMDNLEFAVTRRLTETKFHNQNLLGIGRDPQTNTYFFNTSFLWKVPADIGKKDSIKIAISQ